MSLCPTGASYRDGWGSLQVDKSRCIGLRYCVAACPFHVRYLNPQTGVADSVTSVPIRGWRLASPSGVRIRLPNGRAEIRQAG